MENRTGARDALRAAVLSALLIAPLAGADAAGLGFEVSAGAAQSDNVTRVADGEQDETIATAGLRLSLDERTRRVDTDLVGNFAFYDYLDDTYDSELIGSFVGDATVTLIEDRLKWLLSDDFGQVLNDPLTPSTPGNRENLNYFRTGLEGYLPLGSRNSINLLAQYTLASYEVTPFDSSTIDGEIGFVRQMSGANSLGLHLRTSVLEYDEAELSGSNYDQDEAFLRYDATGSRTKLRAEAGYTRIDPETADSRSDLLLRFEASRQLSTRSLIRLSAGQEFANSAAAFSSEQSGDDVGLGSDPGRQTADPFTYQYADMTFDIEGNRTAMSLSGTWRKQIHHAQPLFDQMLTSAGATLSRDLSSAFRLALNATYGVGKFELDNSDYAELDGGLSLLWQLSRSLAVTLRYDYSDRDSDITGGDYTENRLWLSFAYQHGTPRSSLARPDFTRDASGGGT